MTRAAALDRCAGRWQTRIGGGLCILALLGSAGPARAGNDERVELPRSVLEDKIRGGLLGQILGNLNGVRHEARYIEEPGEVEAYVPSLPDGARTDDDTDIEWVYVLAMEQSPDLLLAPEEITRLWREHINRRIWSANQYARQLMDLGLEPPLTGHSALNPWAGFNIAGQFLCETFALMSPAMPRTAAGMALHYVHVAIDGEPAQATQLFATMIAEAFALSDVEALLDAGLAATDPRSEVHAIVEQVRAWRRSDPEDWQAVRRRIRDAWTRHGGAKRDENGFELNTAATIAALLYGEGRFARTLELAFALGWDADNNAATAGTILGVVHGQRWMQEQGWEIADRYQNTTRDGLPRDETLSRFGDRLVGLALRTVAEQGGAERGEGKGRIVDIPRQQPENVEPLIGRQARLDRLRLELGETIEAAVADDGRGRDLARAAYLALCLDLARELERRYPERWRQALAALESLPQVAQVLYHYSPIPEADRLRQTAAAVGLPRPDTVEPLWTQRFDLYDGAEDPTLATRPLVERLIRYRDGVRQAFAVANIDQVIVETLRLDRAAEESARAAERIAALLRRAEATTAQRHETGGLTGELERALSGWLPLETIAAGRDASFLATRLLDAERALASGAPLRQAELARLAGEVDAVGQGLLQGAMSVRRGIELGQREPIEEGLERLAAELDALLPGG